MTTFNRALSIAALGLALSFANAAEATNLVTNGDFSTNGGGGQVGFNTTLNGWTLANSQSYTFLFGSGTQATSGVTGQYGSLSLWGPGNGSQNGLTSSPAGGYFIAQDGAFQQAAMQQTINGLVAGQNYAVSFYWAGAQQSGFTGATTEQWEVSLGGQNLYTSVVSDPSEGFSGWQYTTLTFTATSSSELLSFLSIGTPSGVPPFALLDGVSMTQVASAPEPASAAVMLTGLAGLMALVWYRRKAAKAVAGSR
ncbi:hypothetical protein [Paludibacterium sp.]|uniref:hypothetical protein n=1 Tax=Paludibacterium sp. TaxID=1917523 RepID=UPI0025F36D68|nr:hypothetical protein [Paludibacterium sp.]MBV8646344.1 hypothetical protein [Paludibacterium sp.]